MAIQIKMSLQFNAKYIRKYIAPIGNDKRKSIISLYIKCRTNTSDKRKLQLNNFPIYLFIFIFIAS